jgi:hypothetical protein
MKPLSLPLTLHSYLSVTWTKGRVLLSGKMPKVKRRWTAQVQLLLSVLPPMKMLPFCPVSICFLSVGSAFYKQKVKVTV